MVAIRISHLTKTYGRSKKPAVDNVSLSIAPGEVYGFLGSNGAGKSTTIRTIMDFLKPTDGTITILGKDSQRDGVELKRSIGYLSGDVALPTRTSGKALLDHLANLHGRVDRDYLSELTRRFEAQLDKKTETLSKGNRQKIGIIQAFMHQPSILILDEPTSGLDPIMQERFYKTVEEAKERGAAVFLSSHSFAEVERICDRIGIIRDGKLVYEAPVGEIMATRVPTWRVTLKKKSDVATLKKNSALHVIDSSGKVLRLEPSGAIESALGALSKVEIASLLMEQRELEDEFMHFYRDDEGGNV